MAGSGGGAQRSPRRAGRRPTPPCSSRGQRWLLICLPSPPPSPQLPLFSLWGGGECCLFLLIFFFIFCTRLVSSFGIYKRKRARYCGGGKGRRRGAGGVIYRQPGLRLHYASCLCPPCPAELPAPPPGRAGAPPAPPPAALPPAAAGRSPARPSCARPSCARQPQGEKAARRPAPCSASPSTTPHKAVGEGWGGGKEREKGGKTKKGPFPFSDRDAKRRQAVGESPPRRRPSPEENAAPKEKP